MILVFSGIAFLVYSVCLGVYRLVLSPLASFPGPPLAALTMWYEFYYDVVKHGQYYKEIERLHSVYGPIVRINPHEIHVRDPDWYNELYTAGGRRRDKSKWFVGRSGGQSIFGTIDHDHHRLRRSALNPFFSKASVSAIEPLIQAKVDRLCDALRKHILTGTHVEMQTAFMALTLDVISDYAFGNSFGLLEIDGFSPEWKKAVMAMIEASIMNRHLPWVADILMNLPHAVAAAISPPVAFFLGIQKEIEAKVKATLAVNSDERKSSHRTIFQELRDSNMPFEEKTVERLKDEGLILIGAGGETTAQTLAVLVFLLLDNPDALNQLNRELRQAIPDPQNPPPWQKLEQLPYLRATIIEAHRVQAVITARLIRIAPTEMLRFHDWRIPAGTPVSMSTHFMHLDPSLFPEPRKFDPDRWFGSAQGMERYVIPYSRGGRACIGLHLANAELYLAVACLFRRFELELYQTGPRDAEITWDGFSGGFRPESKGIRVKMLREVN